MIITKSLFVNFCTSPQLAWWNIHDKKWVYQQIQDAKYWAMDGLAIGEEVEQAVLKLLDWKQIATVSSDNLDFSNRHQSYHDRTQTILAESPEVVYQPSFVIDGLFCKSDLLIKNEQWTYDLREVKAKNSVRKKTKDEPLLDDMLADISFQDYILRRVLWDKYSGRCFFVHLNKEYIKQWSIDYPQLIIKDDVTDECMTDDHIEDLLNSLKTCFTLSKKELDEKFPYTNGDYLTYYGENAPEWSVFNIPRARRYLQWWVEDNKMMISDLDHDDITNLHTKKGEPTTCSQYVELWQQGEQTIVDTNAVAEQLNTVEYPLYFYDYETVSVPVPVFEWSSPRQQVVVQYSCHRIDADGTITHTESLIANGENDNQRIIEQLLNDLNHGKHGSYIVRYKGFENSRNKELAEQYPDYADALLAINEKTFDLMEVFSKLNYFDRRFNGSSSIKKVLPVLTDIRYDDLTVSNGAVAAERLGKLAKWTIAKDEEQQVLANLLEYCKQDTRAMVAIYNKLQDII